VRGPEAGIAQFQMNPGITHRHGVRAGRLHGPTFTLIEICRMDRQSSLGARKEMAGPGWSSAFRRLGLPRLKAELQLGPAKYPRPPKPQAARPPLELRS